MRDEPKFTTPLTIGGPGWDDETDTKACAREGCSQDAPNVSDPYCSAECWNLAMRLESLRLIARLEDEEQPTMDDLLNKRERAKRWTPKTMAEYLKGVGGQ